MAGRPTDNALVLAGDLAAGVAGQLGTGPGALEVGFDGHVCG